MMTERPPLSWPPPGLTRIQGDFWRITGHLTLGGLLLVIPLLLTMLVQDPFDLGGALGDAWWVATLTSLLGIFVLIHAFTGTFRLFRRAIQAMRRGYGWITVALVATDRTRDTGFLLQGARHFSVLTPRLRQGLLDGRLAIAGSAFLGALWLSLGFALALLLGSQRIIAGGEGVVVLTLLPAALAFLLAFVLAAVSGWVTRRARRRWHAQPWSADLEEEEVRAWTRDVRERGTESAGRSGGLHSPWAPSMGAVVTLVAAAFIVIPTLLLVGVMSVSSTLVTLATPATPQLGVGAERAARIEPLRPYLLEPDQDVSPQEAGEILQVLLYVGRNEEAQEGERSPARRYDDPWFPRPDEARSRTGQWSVAWVSRVLDQLSEGVDPEYLERLRMVAEHPAGREFARLARAPSLDVAAGRWQSPLPEGLMVGFLPFPRHAELRDGAAVHHLAMAARAAVEGRLDEAELRIREVISVGFLLMDQGTGMGDNFVGLVIAGYGGDALERLLRHMGREAEIIEMERAREAALRSVARSRPRADLTTAQGLREMALTVTDTAAFRGVRWELFLTHNTGTPCLNLHRIVFGPGADYRAWIEEARASLVRFPSEEELFEMGVYGVFGRSGPEGRIPLLLRPLSSLIVESREPGSCGALLRQILGAP